MFYHSGCICTHEPKRHVRSFPLSFSLLPLSFALLRVLPRPPPRSFILSYGAVARGRGGCGIVPIQSSLGFVARCVFMLRRYGDMPFTGDVLLRSSADGGRRSCSTCPRGGGVSLRANLANLFQISVAALRFGIVWCRLILFFGVMAVLRKGMLHL